MLEHNQRRSTRVFHGVPFTRQNLQGHQLNFHLGGDIITSTHKLKLNNTLYKILAQVLSSIVRDVLPDVIDGNQFTFIKDKISLIVS